MLKIGIVGLPNVGKSTLFKALTAKQVAIENYPFTTIEPNIGIVEVPNEHLIKFAEFLKLQKAIPATIEFVDIAGLVKGASKGEGLGNQFLGHIRDVDVVIEVVRIFQNEEVMHVSGEVNPESDISVLETELAISDLETIEKRIKRLEKVRCGCTKELNNELEILKKIESGLKKGIPARECGIGEKEYGFLGELHLLTYKPILCVFNGAENEIPETLKTKPHVTLDVKLEAELAELTPEEKKELGIESNLGQLIVRAYKLLGLVTFFTYTESEVHAWTIPNGATAIEAAAKIHTDLANGFIRAEVVNCESLLTSGSHTAAREKGLIMVEGRNYIVKEGDVILVKFKM